MFTKEKQHFNNNHPLGGLGQRINSGTLQSYVFILSLYFYKHDLE